MLNGSSQVHESRKTQKDSTSHFCKYPHEAVNMIWLAKQQHLSSKKNFVLLPLKGPKILFKIGSWGFSEWILSPLVSNVLILIFWRWDFQICPCAFWSGSYPRTTHPLLHLMFCHSCFCLLCRQPGPSPSGLTLGNRVWITEEDCSELCLARFSHVGWLCPNGPFHDSCFVSFSEELWVIVTNRWIIHRYSAFVLELNGAFC